MPELPEVETVRRGLVPKLVGRRIVRLIQRRRDLRVPLPAKFAKRVEGRTVLAIDRRAKYLLLRLDDGNTLIAHLGMSGRMILHDAKSAAEHPFERHDHVVFETDEGWQVRFNDARRFGLMLLAADGAVPKHKLFRGLGPEPLDETSTARRSPVVSRDARRPSRPPFSTRRPWSGSAIYMRARRCSWPASRRVAPRIPCRASAPTGWWPPSSRYCCARSTTAARPCATMSSRVVSSATSRPGSTSTIVPARPVRPAPAARSSNAWCNRAA